MPKRDTREGSGIHCTWFPAGTKLHFCRMGGRCTVPPQSFHVKAVIHIHPHQPDHAPAHHACATQLHSALAWPENKMRRLPGHRALLHPGHCFFPTHSPNNRTYCKIPSAWMGYQQTKSWYQLLQLKACTSGTHYHQEDSGWRLTLTISNSSHGKRTRADKPSVLAGLTLRLEFCANLSVEIMGSVPQKYLTGAVKWLHWFSYSLPVTDL